MLPFLQYWDLIMLMPYHTSPRDSAAANITKDLAVREHKYYIYSGMTYLPNAFHMQNLDFCTEFGKNPK